MDYYKSTIPIIDENTISDVAFPQNARFGAVPRDYQIDPVSVRQQPSDLVLIPESEWDARYDEQERTESSLEHLYLRGGQPAFQHLSQGQDGYCWAYSVGHAVMMDRLARNYPFVRLNPHSVAAIIKNGRDEGGWCGLSCQFIRENGIAPEGTGPGQWPKQSRNLQYHTPLVRENMKKYRIEEDWYDLGRAVWDQKLSTQQRATLGFLNIPVPSDFMWWSHSVCQIRWVRIERGSWGPLVLNSWDNWGRFGLGVLRGSRANADNAVAIRTTTAS